MKSASVISYSVSYNMETVGEVNLHFDSVVSREKYIREKMSVRERISCERYLVREDQTGKYSQVER